jgi:hypothetical protein
MQRHEANARKMREDMNMGKRYFAQSYKFERRYCAQRKYIMNIRSFRFHFHSLALYYFLFNFSSIYFHAVPSIQYHFGGSSFFGSSFFASSFFGAWRAGAVGVHIGDWVDVVGGAFA